MTTAVVMGTIVTSSARLQIDPTRTKRVKASQWTRCCNEYPKGTPFHSQTDRYGLTSVEVSLGFPQVHGQ